MADDHEAPEPEHEDDAPRLSFVADALRAPAVGKRHDVPLRALTATFVDPELEREFQLDHHPQIRRFTSLSVTVSLVAFLAYGLHDALVIPSVLGRALVIRYGVFVPFAAFIIPFVFRNRSPRLHQPAMLAFGLAVNVVVLWIGAISPPAGFFIYTGYAVVFVTLGGFIARMGVAWQLAYTAISVALYHLFDQLLAHQIPTVRLSITMTLVTLGGIGAIAAYQLEAQARRAFLQRRIIRDQMDDLDAERRVADSLLRNVLPETIAKRLKVSDEAIADGHREATVLFSDIVGFTELSAKLSPAELVGHLDDIFSRFDDIAGALKLEKIKTIGDAYMVVGGVPVRREDHAAAVCEMALRMQEAIAKMPPVAGTTLSVRIGVHSGPVVAGVIGKKKFIYDVWGDTVNTASRMESHGVPGEIQVSERVQELVRDQFVLEERGMIEVKGKGQLRTFLLRGRSVDGT